MFFSDKAEVTSIIFKAEITSLHVGASIMELLGKYAEELKYEKPAIAEKLMNMVRALKNGKKRWDAYGSYIDEDVAQLLKMADKKNIPVGIIISNYVPAKEMSLKYTSGIRKSLLSPIISFIITTALLGQAVDSYRKPIEDKVVVVSDMTIMIMHNYYLFNFLFIAIIAAMLVLIPHKLPGLKTIFTKLEAILALATIESMLAIGYSTSEIIPEIKKQFKIDFEPKKKNVDGLLDMLRLKNYVNAFESAEIKIMTKQDDPKIAIQKITEERTKAAEKMSEDTSKMISTLAIILISVPALMMVSVFVAFLQAAVSMGSGGG